MVSARTASLFSLKAGQTSSWDAKHHIHSPPLEAVNGPLGNCRPALIEFPTVVSGTIRKSNDTHGRTLAAQRLTKFIKVLRRPNAKSHGLGRMESLKCVTAHARLLSSCAHHSSRHTATLRKCRQRRSHSPKPTVTPTLFPVKAGESGPEEKSPMKESSSSSARADFSRLIDELCWLFSHLSLRDQGFELEEQVSVRSTLGHRRESACSSTSSSSLRTLVDEATETEEEDLCGVVARCLSLSSPPVEDPEDKALRVLDGHSSEGQSDTEWWDQEAPQMDSAEVRTPRCMKEIGVLELEVPSEDAVHSTEVCNFDEDTVSSWQSTVGDSDEETSSSPVMASRRNPSPLCALFLSTYQKTTRRIATYKIYSVGLRASWTVHHPSTDYLFALAFRAWAAA